MQTGVIKAIVAARGFGFVREDVTGSEHFFHVRELSPLLEWDVRLTEMPVQFEVVDTDNGRTRATNVRAA